MVNQNQRSSSTSFKHMWSSLTGNKESDGGDGGSEKDREFAKTVTFQDKLVNSLIEQVIDSPESPDPSNEGSKRHQYAGPLGNGLSLPIMTDNFRRFNGRVGVVFKFQHQVEKLLQWHNPTHTLSLLATLTLVCLHPTLLVPLPFIVFLVFIMVPGYLARHPPPPVTSTSSTTAYYSYDGPALAPAQTVKPVSETSRDFFDNMANLQKSMGDFSDAYDAIVSALLPAANFSNERLSSTIFLLTTGVVMALLCTAHLVPWNLVVLVGGDLAILAGNERVRWHVEQLIAKMRGDVVSGKDGKVRLGTDQKEEEEEEEEKKKQKQKKEKDISTAAAITTTTTKSSGSQFLNSLESVVAITLSAEPEVREVEIFELQHRTTTAAATTTTSLTTSAYSSATPTWETFVFTPTPYDPLSPARIAGDRPQGCRFFEDVKPPEGWTWKGSKWELDLDAKEWVLERMVTGVGVEGVGGCVFDSGVHRDIPVGKGEEMGGWVWDLPPQYLHSGNVGDGNGSGGDWDGYSDTDGDDIPPYASEDWAATKLIPGSGGKSSSRLSRETKKERLKKSGENTRGRLGRDFEERNHGVSSGEIGDWRRRRWVRLVGRKGADEV
ncbi:hypothetical protein KEM54_002716 [Ascosphaera aggregata]|nr:hypothetical protein KEM54_002716 [Ascosphaera aggregata]